MEKNKKSEIVEWLNEMAERARTAYVKTGDDIYRKDNDCIMSAIEFIGSTEGEEIKQKKGDSLICAARYAVRSSREDERLMEELRSMLEKKQYSAKHSKDSAKMMRYIMPGAQGFMPAVVSAVETEADLLKRVYVRLSQLMEGTR